MTTVGAQPDPCEWNPAADRPALTTDTPHAEAQIICGANGQWRLCDSCAQLSRFARYRIRRHINP